MNIHTHWAQKTHRQAKFISTKIVYLFCTLYRGGSVRASLPSPCFSTMQRRHRSDLRSQEHHGLPRQMSHANIKSILDYQVEFTNFEIYHISYIIYHITSRYIIYHISYNFEIYHISYNFEIYHISYIT